jgi:2-polyprenyl-6-methoxyphenol hydroxylase-like FAD-dependent oxidoreductase
MQSDALKSLRIAINGGSIGGLCAGTALHGNGSQADIYERMQDPWRCAGPVSLFRMS